MCDGVDEKSYDIVIDLCHRLLESDANALVGQRDHGIRIIAGIRGREMFGRLRLPLPFLLQETSYPGEIRAASTFGSV